MISFMCQPDRAKRYPGGWYKHFFLDVSLRLFMEEISS